MKIVYSKTFEADGTFGAINAAEQWVKSIGCSVGSMEHSRPIAVARGEWPHDGRWKWRHFNDKERAAFDGRIVPIGRFRDGGARVELNFVPEGES